MQFPVSLLSYYGINYLGDYSASFTDRSLINKSYIDTFINSGEWTPTISSQTNCTVINRKSLYSIRGNWLNIACRFSFNKNTTLPPSSSSFKFNVPSAYQILGNIHSEISLVSYNLYSGMQVSYHKVDIDNGGAQPWTQLIFNITFSSSPNISVDILAQAD
jgi:hypothetical protein